MASRCPRLASARSSRLNSAKPNAGRSRRLPDVALFSLWEKTGAAELAKALTDRGFEIFATGGTRAYLNDRGIEAHDVEKLTGFPPLFDGRVKTLHPRVF